MAAYGALVSVMNIIDQIQSHPRPPISLHQKQVESLTQLITFLQDFLEGYSPHVGYTEEEDIWESRIADAAYAAEDVIESYIVDQILARSTNAAEEISSIEFYQGVQRVVEEMDLIKMEVVEVKEKMLVKHLKRSATDAGLFRSTSTGQKVTMVGFDDVLYQMLEKIATGGLSLEIIPIVGMGGIGKTTLARNIYVHPFVEQHFDISAWSKISQEYNAREILRQLLDQVDKRNKDRGNLDEHELGEELYKFLIGRRYLIVMDDIWSIEAWDEVSRFFPDNENGSRIVVTTRLSNLASKFSYSNGLYMKFLDEATSWNLFSKTVFGEEICPLELKEIGMEIVKGCKGLPLSIAVIGGLLSKSEPTLENWKSIEGNLSSVVNLEDNESCLQILYMSYNNLPIYIKPCFLHMGVIPEDEEIPISQLIPILVADGFVKPIDGRSLEEAAEDYLEELVDRNLVLVEKSNLYGKVKSFKIHDLLRDVCLREARKLKFLCVLGEHDILQGINSQRRIQSSLSEYPTPLLQSLESASLVRSLIGTFPDSLSSNFRLLRVAVFGPCSEEESGEYNYEDIFHRLVNLRFLCVDVDEHPLPRIPSSVSFLWNLQTLLLFNVLFVYVFEIWKMPQLRHVMTYIGTLDAAHCFPDPLSDEVLVLENLQTLFVVSNLNFGEGVLQRIPNIKKLKLFYYDTSRTGGSDHCCLNNLGRFLKLETLSLRCLYGFRIQLTFPYSLKKLTLQETKLPWDDMKTKIGWLPLLQVLKLKRDAFVGSEWETFEGQFSSLVFLLIDRCGLECWITDDSHFPLLEHLVLRNASLLKEIPSSIGDIATLRSIELEDCIDSVVDSAQRIIQEQDELGNEGLQLRVRHTNKKNLPNVTSQQSSGEEARLQNQDVPNWVCWICSICSSLCRGT